MKKEAAGMWNALIWLRTRRMEALASWAIYLWVSRKAGNFLSVAFVSNLLQGFSLLINYIRCETDA
jgi:hypothetical protein